MRRTIQDGCLWIYRIAFADGILRYGWGRRIFFVLYDAYKTLIEAGETGHLKLYVPPGSLVIDVGANVGFFTLKFARWVGVGGRVIAIEPEAVNFSELTRRISAFGMEDRVTVHRAVADRSAGEILLAINPYHPGDHKIGKEGVATAAVTVDGLVLAEDRPVALIKIDVQGAEMRVLAGAETVLARDRPVLFVEVDSSALAHFDSSTSTLLDSLSRLGYVPHTIDRRGARVLTLSMVESLIALKGYTDILFIADPSGASAVQ